MDIRRYRFFHPPSGISSASYVYHKIIHDSAEIAGVNTMVDDIIVLDRPEKSMISDSNKYN